LNREGAGSVSGKSGVTGCLIDSILNPCLNLIFFSLHLENTLRCFKL
jgi:hypothetical protein